MKTIKNIPSDKLIISESVVAVHEHLPVQHANADAQVKCLTPETPDHHLKTGSSPAWAYAQHVVKSTSDSGSVRLPRSSSITDLLPEATPVLGYSRWRKKGKRESKETQHQVGQLYQQLVQLYLRTSTINQYRLFSHDRIYIMTLYIIFREESIF